MLYVIDHERKNIIIICTQPIRDCFKDEPWKQYILRLVDIIPMYRSAMRVHQPGWEEHLFEWKHLIADGIPKNIPRHLTGYIILQYMSSIHSAKATPIYTDNKTLRQNFLVDVLWSRRNAYRRRLPKGVQDYLARITGKSL